MLVHVRVGFRALFIIFFCVCAFAYRSRYGVAVVSDIQWTHATNSRQKLWRALQSDAHFVETDVAMGEYAASSSSAQGAVPAPAIDAFCRSRGRFRDARGPESERTTLPHALLSLARMYNRSCAPVLTPCLDRRGTKVIC